MHTLGILAHIDVFCFNSFSVGVYIVKCFVDLIQGLGWSAVTGLIDTENNILQPNIIKKKGFMKESCCRFR